MKVGFIGAGNMAGAIIAGMCADGFAGEDIWAYDPCADKLDALEASCGITVCPSGSAVASSVDVLVLAVKPQMLESVVPALRDALLRSEPLVVSIAAGKDIAFLEKLIGFELPVVRVMPNIAAKVGEAMSAYCGNAAVTEEHKASVRRILEACGAVTEMAESQFSAFSVLAGCSPAFTLQYIDALASAGVRYGIPKDKALEIVCQAVLGTARLLQESGIHPRQLADTVCSPAGTTIEGVVALQQAGFEGAVQAAAEASVRRDRELMQ